jgi:hypothetical protein
MGTTKPAQELIAEAARLRAWSQAEQIKAHQVQTTVAETVHEARKAVDHSRLLRHRLRSRGA